MKKPYIYILLAGLILTGCEIDQRDILPESGFTKIYNHPEETLAFYTESIAEVSGGGFIFISAVKDETSEIEYPATYIVRTSASGEVLWSQEYAWLAPCSNLVKQGNTIGFVAMNAQFEAYLIIIDPETGNESGQYALNMTMPLYAYTDPQGKLLVLGYDFVSRSSWISLYGSDHVLERSVKLEINTDLEYEIQRHLNKTGQNYPFFIGEYGDLANSGYFVNCFSNYTLRTVFLNRSSLQATGDIYSFRTEEGVSSILHKNGTLFGLTSYYEGNNYILPNSSLNVSGSQNIKDIPGEALYELTFKARVKSGIIVADSLEYALFVSQTNTNSLILYQYSMESDSLVYTLQKDFDQKVEVSDVIQSADRGIVILADTYILGKYKRPMVVKFPEHTFIPEEE